VLEPCTQIGDSEGVLNAELAYYAPGNLDLELGVLAERDLRHGIEVSQFVIAAIADQKSRKVEQIFLVLVSAERQRDPAVHVDPEPDPFAVE
jgi:hypothetical protein